MRKPIPSYEGFYEIDDFGRIWRVNAPRARPLKPALTGGYWRVVLSKNAVKKNFFVHQLVLLAFEGPCPAGQQVRHRDGVRSNIRLSNLHYGTAQQNIDDREVHGRTARGEKHGMALLNEAQVLEIRAARYEKVRNLGVRYGVSPMTIEAIRYGRLWRHIQ